MGVAKSNMEIWRKTKAFWHSRVPPKGSPLTPQLLITIHMSHTYWIMGDGIFQSPWGC